MRPYARWPRYDEAFDEDDDLDEQSNFSSLDKYRLCLSCGRITEFSEKVDYSCCTSNDNKKIVTVNNGIDLNDFVKAISYGGGQNFYMDGKAQNIINNEYKTAFSVANMHKDAHLMNDLLKENNLSYPGFINTMKVYDKAMDMGLEKEDFSATFKVVNKR